MGHRRGEPGWAPWVGRLVLLQWWWDGKLWWVGELWAWWSHEGWWSPHWGTTWVCLVWWRVWMAVQGRSLHEVRWRWRQHACGLPGRGRASWVRQVVRVMRLLLLLRMRVQGVGL